MFSEDNPATSRAAQILPRSRQQLQKTCNNVKITVLCGLVTILVLHGTASLNSLISYKAEHLIQETYRVLVTENEAGTTEFISPSPSLMSRKTRVLLVTGSPPDPCGNPIADHYSLKEIKNKLDYGRIHKIEIFYNMAVLEEKTVSWAKVSLIRQLMLSHPEVEWFWWMDSNSLFTNMTFAVPFSKYEDYNMVVFNDQRSINTGIFLIRNCQWSLDMFAAWRQLGAKGTVDDQSALIDLLVTDKNDTWINKIVIENSFYAHWEGLIGKYQSGGEEWWHPVTHFVGCEICPRSSGKSDLVLVERCLKGMERAFNFADNQILDFYGFRHEGLLSTNVTRIRNETDKPLVDSGHFDTRRSLNHTLV